MPFLSFVSGLLVLFIGLTLSKIVCFRASAGKQARIIGHEHSAETEHSHADEHHAHDGLRIRTAVRRTRTFRPNE
jgi:ABC-type nickel/cobalt efflux system permease component RcnA